MSILDYVPKGFDKSEDCPRWQNQKLQLLQIEKNWNKYDIFVSQSAVGSGKTLILQTVARWRASKDETTATITHRVNLMRQFKRDFKDVPVLMGKTHYTCGSGVGTCEDHYEMFESYCDTCSYKKVKIAALESKNAIFNYQSYIYNNAYKQNLLIDEADQAYDIIAEMYSIKLWKKQHKYPSAKTHGEIAIWLEKELKKLYKQSQSIVESMGARKKAIFSKGKHKITTKDAQILQEYQSLSKLISKFKKVLAGLQRSPGNFFIEEITDVYRGTKQKALQIRPTSLNDLPDRLWPEDKTNKIVLMSGTINDIDLQSMGLLGRKIYNIDTIDPIPSDRKPIIVENPFNMSFKYQDKNIIAFAEQIKDICSRHPDTKGLIHMTYALAAKVRPYLQDDKRFMFHEQEKESRERVLDEFLTCKSPKVLIGCGMGVGLDLKGPTFGFQIVAKILWPNRGDKLINYLYEKQFDRILWLTCKTVIQQWGRICRNPQDYGVTYIIDGGFGNLKKKRWGLIKQGLKYFPKEFLDSITWR